MKSLLSSLVLTLICIFSYSQTPSILLFKDTNAMTMILNPYRFAAEEAPIMSFQTNKSGTFNATLRTSTGVLKWVIDGVEYITDVVSAPLVGDVVNIDIYANGVPEGTDLTSCLFINMNLIGTLDLSYFKINGQVQIYVNANNLVLLFGNYANVSTNLTVFSAKLQSLDLSTFVQYSSSFRIANNLSIGNQDLSGASGSISYYDIYRTGFIGAHEFFDSITYSGIIYLYGNSGLTSIINGVNVISCSNLRVDSCNLSILSLAKFNISGTGDLFFFSNPNMDIFNDGGNTHSVKRLRGYFCNLTLCVMSNITISEELRLENNVNLTTFSRPLFTTGLATYSVSNCALDLTSVDGILSDLNTFFSANTPIKNLVVSLSGGTNASPTNGAANADILSLISIFNTAGFTFTATIN